MNTKQTNPIGLIISILLGIALISGLGFYLYNQQSATSNSSNTDTTAAITDTAPPSSQSGTANKTSLESSSNSTILPSTPSSDTSSTNNEGTKEVASNDCIITIRDQKYNVTSLKPTHPGGNVFKCGEDNTSTFFSRHNQRWLDTRMTKYKV